MIQIAYTLFFTLTVISALMVVFSRHAVYSALYLVVTMVSIAGIFILINAQLAAFLQILVYAGAIMVLFLFVIMLLNLGRWGDPPVSTSFIRRFGGAFLIVFLVQLAILAIKFGGGPKLAEENARTATISEVALLLLTRYLYAFEMTSLLLLIAVVGAMVLARKSISQIPHPSGESADDGERL